MDHFSLGLEMNFANLIWDPDRNFFVVPYIKHPVTWYGLFFALGFLVGYFFVRKIFTRFLKDEKLSSAEIQLAAVKLTDRLAMLVILGTIIGARLGHVFFYGWSYYQDHLLDIFKVWEGGLASHGGALGVLLALAIFVIWNKKTWKKITFLSVLDILVIPASFVGGCIRIGNFINQEITGIPTTLPWGVIFKHPIDGMPDVPLHPVQLYESVTYFAVFALLYFVWKVKESKIGLGLFSDLFFTLVFSARFLLEFFKMPQNKWMYENAPISMGQLLSLPFIFLGISLLIWYTIKRKNHDISSF